MVQPRALVLTGYGINCDEETAFAFRKAGGLADIVHVSDVIEDRARLGHYQILAFPGGFSYGDDTGAGNALANRLRNHLSDELKRFVSEDHLVIGICNGFQVMANLGLVPAHKGQGEQEVALMHNDSARYVDRWVDLELGDKSPWTKGIGRLSLPIAHGEGKFYATPAVLEKIRSDGLVAARYVQGDVCNHFGLPYNPNGALEDIAGITDVSGRILGMMPHPERAVDFTHLPHWTLVKEKMRRAKQQVPTEGPGMQIFRKGVKYFS